MKPEPSLTSAGEYSHIHIDGEWQRKKTRRTNVPVPCVRCGATVPPGSLVYRVHLHRSAPAFGGRFIVALVCGECMPSHPAPAEYEHQVGQQGGNPLVLGCTICDEIRRRGLLPGGYSIRRAGLGRRRREVCPECAGRGWVENGEGVENE